MRVGVVLLFTSTLLSLVAAELVFRVVLPGWVLFFPPHCFRPDLYQRWDAYGYRLWPSQVMRQTYDGPPARTVTYRSNRHGFRSPQRDPADRRPRIVVLGDSLTFGIGVEEAERFTERLEAAHPDWRVDNLGMIGFGPDLMLRALDAVGLDPPPAVVVMAVFTDDFRRVVRPYAGAGFPIPRFVLEGAELVTVPYPEPWWFERLRLVQGIYYALWRYTPATRPLNEAIFDAFLQRAATRGFTPVLLFLPGARAGWDDRQRARWITEYAATRPVAFRDLSPWLVDRMDQYLADGSHLSVAGHATVATALDEVLVPLVAR